MGWFLSLWHRGCALSLLHDVWGKPSSPVRAPASLLACKPPVPPFSSCSVLDGPLPAPAPPPPCLLMSTPSLPELWAGKEGSE